MPKHALAIKKTHDLPEIEPGYSPANGLIGFAYLAMQRFDEAIEQFEIMFEGMSSQPRDVPAVGSGAADKTDVTGPDPEALGFLGYVYGVVGKRNKALDVLGELMELRKKRYVQPHNVALVYIGLGEDDSAFEWLDKAFTDVGL